MMNKLGIYIHIPFCVKKCDYCDFLSAPSDKETMKSYVEALKNEIKGSRNKMRDYLVDTVFIGGGTPSILEGRQILELISTLKASCCVSGQAELTIECNPGTVTKEKLKAYKEAGINRLSLGLQSSIDTELKSIGRIHNYAQFLESYTMARQYGFDNINVDIMEALPGQTTASCQKTVEAVVALAPEHISAYSLIVEEGTEMKKRVEKARSQGVEILPDEDEERQMYDMTGEVLAKNGYQRYEISNYARPGFECAHNIGYWKRKPYLGFGIGAASLYRERRYRNITDINMYLKRLSGPDVSGWDISRIEENFQNLSQQEQMEEFMFLGLRMMQGISLHQFEQKFQKNFDEIYGKVSDRLISSGLLERSADRIRLTRRGIDISNYVMAEFLF